MNQTPALGRYPADSLENITRTLEKGNATPFDSRFSAGEVGTVDAKKVKCYDIKDGELVEVPCPDIIIISAKAGSLEATLSD